MASRGGDKPNRLDVFGDSMLNKLPGISRKRRKRQASKKRRVKQQSDLKTSQDETRQ
jgi:hypothetical protein